MKARSSREGLLWSSKTKALAAGTLMAVMMAASPAHAETTYTVNSTGDGADLNPTDGVCDANPSFSVFECTLRAAIDEANTTSGGSTINFNIPGSGVQTIKPTKPLVVVRHTTINGYSQPGASPNTLAKGDNAVIKIELNGANAGNVSGLDVDGGRFSVIRGLAINRFAQVGVEVSAPDVTVEGNFIGTDPSGTIDRGNGSDGVLITKNFSSVAPFSDIVGGFSLDARNIISGNGGAGIRIDPSSTSIDPSTGSNNEVRNNYVGTDKNGTGNLGNTGDGVLIFGATNNEIGGGTNVANTIAFNGGNGVFVNTASQGPATGNRILANSIFSNGGLGIDLISNTSGATPNDTGDADVGPNILQNFPVITSAKNTSTKTNIAGKLNSAASTSYVVQFFSNPSGNEGKKFIGETLVTTDASGNASFTFQPIGKVAAGQTITATATDPANNTSEFSAPKTVGKATLSGLAPDTTKLSGPSGVTKNPTAHFKFTSPDLDATFECSLDGGAYYPCSSPENVHGLSDGRHTFEVRARDKEGNQDPTPAAWIWAVDRKK